MKNGNTLKSLMKKNPHLYKHFCQMQEREENFLFKNDIVIALYLKIRNHHNLIKVNKINLLEINNFEKMDDLISKLIRESSLNKFISSFLSSKYKKLLNENCIELFSQIYDLKLEKNILNQAFKKVARIHDEKNFESFLVDIIKSNSNFGLSSTLKIIKEQNLNVDVISINHKKNNLILRINDYKSSNILGSSSWCISYSKRWFDNYMKRKCSFGLTPSQYFIFNFDLPQEHRYSKIGVTVSKNTYIFAADRFDRAIPGSSNICKKIQRIHNEWIDESYLMRHFLSFVVGKEMEDLNHLMDCLSSVNFKDINSEDLILLSNRLDDFSTKSMKKRTQTFFYKVVSSKYDTSENLDESVVELIKHKYPKVSLLLQKNGYNIKSMIFNKTA